MFCECRRLIHDALAALLVMAAFFALGTAPKALAEEYLTRDEFLQLAFGDDVAAMQTVWLTKTARAAAQEAVGWTPPGLRVRYWEAGQRTAWIMEDIGKVKPITIGVVILDNEIERIDILAFRESRGWEVRYPFFTEQFRGLTLRSDGYLSNTIDGITGATLSVRAVERVTRLALWLDTQAQ